MTLGRSTYSSTDYASAVRRSSLFDGYAGFSIYSSISQGLDEITYGGRRSRRGSLSTTTAVDSTYAFTSRRGSVTANSVDYAALMAATAALEAVSSTNKQKKAEAEETSQAESGLGNSPKSINLSRQNSTRYYFFKYFFDHLDLDKKMMICKCKTLHAQKKLVKIKLGNGHLMVRVVLK